MYHALSKLQKQPNLMSLLQLDLSNSQHLVNPSLVSKFLNDIGVNLKVVTEFIIAKCPFYAGIKGLEQSMSAFVNNVQLLSIERGFKHIMGESTFLLSLVGQWQVRVNSQRQLKQNNYRKPVEQPSFQLTKHQPNKRPRDGNGEICYLNDVISSHQTRHSTVPA